MSENQNIKYKSVQKMYSKTPGGNTQYKKLGRKC